MTDQPWPTELRLSKDRRMLSVAFDSGESFDLSAEYLRVESPSAEVQGHTPEQKKIVPGKANVEIIDIKQVGNYAVQISFDDLHDSGYYDFRWLLRLGRDKDRVWNDYLAGLAAKGLSREGASKPALELAPAKAGGCGSGSCGCGN